MTEKQIARIRDEINSTRFVTWEIPESIEQSLNDRRLEEINEMLSDVYIDALEWVLREIMEVTP